MESLGVGVAGDANGLRRDSPGVSTAVPKEVGYALGYRKPKIGFQERRQALQYVDELRCVLELTVSVYFVLPECLYFESTRCVCVCVCARLFIS